MNATLYTRHAGPLGELLLVAERDAAGWTVLTGCYLPGHRRGPSVDPAWVEDPDAFRDIADALDAACGGDPASLRSGAVRPGPGDPASLRPGALRPGPGAPSRGTRDVRFAFRHGTPFQRRVWQELRTIPRGTTLTYAQLAAQIGRPGAARAVGSAVARNPLSTVVPCHRVVGADGSLTGYAGGLSTKRRLLTLEGALPAEAPPAEASPARTVAARALPAEPAER